MNIDKNSKLMVVLMIEDNPVDVLLIKEALSYTRILNDLHVLENGLDAIAFLSKQGEHTQSPRPDIILLDLNLPGMKGNEILNKIKHDIELQSIPIIIFSSSDTTHDINNAYNNYANCYIKKPVDFDGYTKIIRGIYDFWFGLAELPRH